MIRRTVLVLLLAAVPAAIGPAYAQFDLLTLKPITKAVREGDAEKVRGQLLKGESPNQIDTSAQPLIMVATVHGHLAVVEVLIKAGAIVDTTDRDGYTSLIRAAERGDVDIADLLLKSGAKPNAQTRQGVSAMMVAARLGSAEIVRLLLDKKANPNLADFTGRTAMTYAKQAGRGSVEVMLRKAGGRD